MVRLIERSAFHMYLDLDVLHRIKIGVVHAATRYSMVTALTIS